MQEFNSKDIENPYEFIDSLYYRLTNAREDVKKVLRESYYSESSHLNNREFAVLDSIINWIERYSKSNN